MQLRGAGKGFLFMAAATAGIFFVLQALTSTVIGFLGAVGLLGGWMFLNRQAGTTGLVKSNVRAYFQARQQGSTHDEALRRMVKSRYPRSWDDRMAVWGDAGGRQPMNPGRSEPLSDEEAAQLKTLVYAVFVNENGPPPSAHWHQKILGYIKEGYTDVTVKGGLRDERGQQTKPDGRTSDEGLGPHQADQPSSDQDELKIRITEAVNLDPSQVWLYRGDEAIIGLTPPEEVTATSVHKEYRDALVEEFPEATCMDSMVSDGEVVLYFEGLTS